MNREANNIIAGMKAMAKGQARNNSDTQVVKWRGIFCRYFPASDRISWTTSGDITRTLSRRQVTSLINIELVDCAEARKAASGTETPARQLSIMTVD